MQGHREQCEGFLGKKISPFILSPRNPSHKPLKRLQISLFVIREILLILSKNSSHMFLRNLPTIASMSTLRRGGRVCGT
jgi:hypothetical protein